MNENEKICQIALTLLRGVGASNAKLLVNYLGNTENLFSCSQQDLLHLPGIQPKAVSNLISQLESAYQKAQKEYQICQQKNITTLFYTDKNYPKALLECTDAPLLLYTKGNINFNAGTYVSIVGTRQATDYGKEQCFELVNGLAQSIPNLVIVSGLAYGIDIAAHKAALQCHVPTIGVMAGGFNRIYPSAHIAVANQMLEKGGIVTEQLYYDEPLKPNFIKRNRIIAGLCDALVVVESAAKGGALVTASIAGTYNKDVFVFPGRCNDTVSAGCNALIKHNKAALIENASDLMDAMGWKHALPSKKSTLPERKLPAFFNELSPIEQTIVQCIFDEKLIHIDALSDKTKISMGDLLPLLLMLEFQNAVVCLPGSMYQVK